MEGVWIRGAQASHAGPVRAYNEDACLFLDDDEGAIAMVADGMGGGTSGRPAADLAVETCLRVFAAKFDLYAEEWWKAEHGGEPPVLWEALPVEERRALR